MYLPCAPVLQGSLHRRVIWAPKHVVTARIFILAGQAHGGERMLLQGEIQPPPPVNTLINNWQDYAKYDRSLILTRCSSLSRLIKHEQHQERKHRRPKQHKHLPLLPFLCQGDANLQPRGDDVFSSHFSR